MKTVRRILLGLSVSALCGHAVVAQAETMTLDVMHAWPGHNPFYEKVAQAFTKENPDIVIRFRASPPSYDEAHQAVLRSMMTGQLPDVYFSGFHLLPELVHALQRRKQAVDLKPFIEKEPAQWLTDNYESSILKLAQVNGTQYGLAFNASTPVIFYNADLVKKAGGDPDAFPTDWASLMALAARIGKTGDGTNGMAYDVHAWPDDWLWRALIMEQGAPIMNQDGKTVAFGGESGLHAMKKARSFVTDGAMALRDFDQSRQQFVSGKLGFIFASPNSARAFSELIGTRFELRSSVFPLENRETGKVPTGGNAMMILAKDDKRQQAAWKFIKYATGPKGQTDAVLGSGYMPTNKIALQPEYLGDFYKKNPNWETSLKQIQYASPWGGYPGNSGVQIWRTQRDIIGSVMRGNVTPEDGLAKMVEATNALLAK
ncbi:sugar ABC transporter substrate-binding protein [Advenella kashmirensis W13003]|uniref:Sugar ABC transporter substrate-binding protein n=1 Tax=Advenella kashmirensis W13003 TaxID=1424334 RepID=V8QX35_9BURK|nr:ABC transporter substrate-binding protein [Advenella kashmirensis]ETF03880.1 sugar ABC transporter substrate-binding protein [Advenella kashmirensis W13003]